MKAKDTVMKENWLNEDDKSLLLKQAEISFKAGFKEGERAYGRGYRAGIREVVKLIDNTGLIEHTNSSLHKTGATILDCPACCWYAYKKKWEVK